MLGTVRNVDGINQPFTIAGLSDGSTDIVHRECNEEYQIPMAVDCQYGAGYLGITDCCKFLFNPATGVAKVNCIETTTTCVDINNNSDIGSNQPILAQGFDEDNLYDNTVEKTTVVYNANCYLCNDPVTGDPVCKPVLKATTFCADEYLGLPKDYPVKYVDTLPVSPDIEDYIYSYDETESLVGKPLKVIRDKYFGAANTKCIVLDGKTVADIGANYTYWTDTDGTSYMSTQDSSYSDSCVVETAFKAGDAANQLLYDIGSGEGGEGSLELNNLPTSGTANLAFVDQYGKIAYCDTGVQACKDSSGNLVLKRENITATFSPTGLTESSEDASHNCRQTLDEANGFRRAICCGNRCSIINQDKYGFTTTSYTDSDISWVSSNIDCPVYAVQNHNGIETSSFRTGISYNNGTSCTYDFEVKSCCNGLSNDLKFNTNLRYCGYGLSYTGSNNVNGSYNSLGIGNGAHTYTEMNCAGENLGNTENTYIDDTLSYNNRIKTIKSKAAEENTYKQLKLQTHLNTSVHDSSVRYECIEMTYSCVCCGNTCFEGKTKYCTTNGKWYVCCDSTKGYKCLLNEDEMPTASVSVNANNDNSWYSLVGTTDHTDLIYSCVNYVRVHPDAGRIQAVGGFTNDNSAILCVEHTNELNVIPGSGDGVWINHRGGASRTLIGNGEGTGTMGTLYAALVDSNLKGRIMMNDGLCATDCNFMPYSGTAGVYGMKEGDWSHFLTFSHGNFDTYYGTAVQVPFWDNQRFTWRVRANGTLCPIHELLDDRGGQQINGLHYYWMGECAVGSRNPAIKMSSTTSGAGYNGGFWIGHNNQNYDGYWGFAEFGFYNRENDTLCPGLCVGRNGDVHAGDIYTSGSFVLSNVQNQIAYKATSFNGFTIQDNQTCALYIEGREGDSGDSGGIVITNDGVTAFGAGDTDGVFRVVNEDNVVAGAVFKVMKGGDAYAAGNIYVCQGTGTAKRLATVDEIGGSSYGHITPDGSTNIAALLGYQGHAYQVNGHIASTPVSTRGGTIYFDYVLGSWFPQDSGSGSFIGVVRNMTSGKLYMAHLWIGTSGVEPSWSIITPMDGTMIGTASATNVNITDTL